MAAADEASDGTKDEAERVTPISQLQGGSGRRGNTALCFTTSQLCGAFVMHLVDALLQAP